LNNEATTFLMTLPNLSSFLPGGAVKGKNKTYYVDAQFGNDKFPGELLGFPFKTVKKATDIAKGGDCIFVRDNGRDSKISIVTFEDIKDV